MERSKKTAIIVPANLKYAPYVKYYTDVLDSNGVSYSILSWDKEKIAEPVDCALSYPVSDADRKRIFLGYFKFARICKRYIRKNKIDKLIVMTGAPAFFLGKRFLKRFKNNFILDIRDDSPLIRKFPKHFQKICALASEVIVSSNEFSPWTARKTMLCHNADVTTIEKYKESSTEKPTKEQISIVFAGMMIESKANLAFLSALNGDERFCFHYIGRSNAGKEEIANYTKKEKMNNVFFEGTYKKEDIVDIYRSKADLINIIRAKTTVNRNALPNKLYDAVIAGKPLLIYSHNKAIADYAKKFHLGIILEETDTECLGDTISEKLSKFDYVAFNAGRLAFLNEVLNDMALFSQRLINFIEQ